MPLFWISLKMPVKVYFKDISLTIYRYICFICMWFNRLIYCLKIDFYNITLTPLYRTKKPIYHKTKKPKINSTGETGQEIKYQPIVISRKSTNVDMYI
jgi:hypothetical protein